MFWNPGAISYLCQLLLAAVLALYLGARVFREWRQGRFYPPTLLLTILMAAVVPGLLTTMFRVLTAGGWVSYAMPWSPLGAWTTLAMPWARPFAGVVSGAMILLAYQFPVPLRGARREAIAVAIVLALMIALEAAIAVRSDIAILQREAWWRPDWITGWMNFGMIWAAIVFWRQLAMAQNGSGGWTARFGAGIAAIWRRAANREAKAARAFVIITLLPIVHTTALFLPREGLFGRYPVDIFICWSMLAQLVALALVLVGYLPERSSFLFKLTAISLAVMLAAINGAAWMIAPAYEAQFRATAMVSSGQALRYMPGGSGREYAMRPHPYRPEPARGRIIGKQGEHIVLPFAMPFYGRSYRAIHVGGDGIIGFDAVPRPVDAAFGQGVQPAIYPLLVEVPEQGTRITAFADGDRFVVTRFDRCTPATVDRCYQVQTVLHADGDIDVRYLYVPPAPRFWLFSPTNAPWLTGITPGADTAAGRPMIIDYYREFLAYLDRLYAPVVGFTIGAVLALLLGMPLLFRGFLIRPLDRLLLGIRRFRGGGLDTQVAVSFNDEIGYLTDSFNEMARSQQAMLHGLEQRVAERVAEIGAMTARNAQLEERNRLSAELHDAVAQTISSASLLANALPAQLAGDADAGRQTAERIAQLSRHALVEMQMLLRELRSEDGRALTDRLAELVRTFSDLHPLTIDCDFAESAALPAEVAAIFYRVAQESLNNIVKHSGAGRAALQFEALADRALLVVSDDGRGFDPETLRTERLGLAIMRDRARRIDATLEIESRAGQGCRVTMIWIQSRGGRVGNDARGG